MGVKVDDMYVGPAPLDGPEAAQGHQMLAPKQHRQLACGQNLLRPALNVQQRQLRAAKAQLQITAVEDAIVGQVLVLVRAVRLQAEALMAHGGGAEPGAGTEAGSGVERGAEQNDARFLKAAVAADKGLDIGIHLHSTSFSISSKNAGRQKAPTCRRTV